MGPPTQIHVVQQPQQQQTQQPGSLLRNMMSQAGARSTASAPATQPGDLSVNGMVYHQVNAATTFRVSHNHASLSSQRGALIDGGANGGLLGADARVLEYVPHAYVDVTSVAGAKVDNLPLVQAASVVESMQDGLIIILIMSQYAYLGEGKTIHSKGQLESFGTVIDDTLRKANGRQMLIMSEGYSIPIHIRDGLPYIDMCAASDKDLGNPSSMKSIKVPFLLHKSILTEQ